MPQRPVAIVTLLLTALSCAPASQRTANPRERLDQATQELIRETERTRLDALVRADTAVADRLHAADFQLITPGGFAYSKSQYLGMIGSGTLKYTVWRPETIDVRLYGAAAVIRYRARLGASANGAAVPEAWHWHTDLYENRDGRWQIVWSQATAIRQP